MASVETHWFVVTCLRTFFDLSQKLSKGTFAQQWDPDRTTASDWKFPNLIKVLRFSWNFKISITCFNYHTCFNQVQRATKKNEFVVKCVFHTSWPLAEMNSLSRWIFAHKSHTCPDGTIGCSFNSCAQRPSYFRQQKKGGPSEAISLMEKHGKKCGEKD